MADNDKDDLDKFSEEAEDKIKPIETAGDKKGDGRPSMDFLPKIKEKILAVKAIKTADGAEIPADIAAGMFDNDQNILHKGDYIDLRKKIPGLKKLYIAAGWEQKALEENHIDIDLSCFLLDKNGQTRVDSDFLYYNNDRACDGAVNHLGDNRTGAGEGDNETIFLDLNGIPFEVLKVMFVLSVYDENRDGIHLDRARNIFLRFVDPEDGMEILRMPLSEEQCAGQSALMVASLVREGPKWFIEALADGAKGGLAALAKGYGLLLLEETGT